MAGDALPADALGDTDAVLRLSTEGGQPLPPLRGSPAVLAQPEQAALGQILEEENTPQRVYPASAKVPMLTLGPNVLHFLTPKEMDDDRYRRKGFRDAGDNDFGTKENPQGRDATGQELYDAYVNNASKESKPRTVSACTEQLTKGENLIVWRQGGTYGLPNVVANIRNIAPALKPIVPLRVGHISAYGGGPLRRGVLKPGKTNVFHKSHMEGRDVDFFLPPAPGHLKKEQTYKNSKGEKVTKLVDATEWYISGINPKANPSESAQMVLGIFFHSWLAVEHIWVIDDKYGRTFKEDLRKELVRLITNVVADKPVREAHLRALKAVAGQDQAKEYAEAERTIRSWTNKENPEYIKAAVEKYVVDRKSWLQLSGLVPHDPVEHTYEFHFRFIPDKINPCFGMANVLTILLLRANDINPGGSEPRTDDFEPPSEAPEMSA